jgi:AcrR family transcriptional regulator
MPKQTLRARRKEETRRLLEEKARGLFARHGFRRTSIDQIASAAGVSRTTFFRYFPSKEAVVFASQHEGAEEFARLLTERPRTENALRAFEEAIVTLAQRGEADPVQKQRALELWALYAENPELHARLADNTLAWGRQMAAVLAARDGLSEPETRHQVASAVGMELLQQVNEEWQRSSGKLPAEGLIRQRFRVLRELAGGKA